MSARKSISNSFTVNTVEDGATLTAKSAIHSVVIRCTSDGKSDGSGSSSGMVTLYVDGAAVPTTHLSIKSQPSGLTVLTHTQQSAIPEGGVSISWANNVDRTNLEGEVVLTVSYDSYSTEFSIPIICATDGEDGTDGKTYALKLTVPSLVIPCDSSGNSKASGNKDCYVTMYVDGTAVQTSSMTLTVISKPTSITVQTYADVSQIAKNRLYITYSANVARTNLEGTILFSISDGTNTTYSSIAVVCANDGQQGKTGRFFYYGKEFNTSRTDTFSATDTEAPFFYYNSNYWLYKGENFSNKTITQIQSAYGAPSNNNDNWEIMVSDFKYLITEAIFGNYAHFGSAIINGDWMISQYGTINGVVSNQYWHFNPAHPNDGNGFIPNYCVDLLNGVTYQNKAVVRGNIYANKMYTRLERLNLNELYDSSIHGVDWDDIDWENITSRYKDGVLPSVLVLMSGNVSAGQNRPVSFILPNASDWSNFMFDLYVQKTYKYSSGSTTYFSDEIKVYANGGSQTAFTDLLNGGDGYYIYESYSIPTSNGNTMNAHNKDKNTFVAGWKPCWHVKLLSDGSQWVVVEQEDSDIFTV